LCSINPNCNATNGGVFSAQVFRQKIISNSIKF
jgi:hypothetical protein